MAYGRYLEISLIWDTHLFSLSLSLGSHKAAMANPCFKSFIIWVWWQQRLVRSQIFKESRKHDLTSKNPPKKKKSKLPPDSSIELLDIHHPFAMLQRHMLCDGDGVAIGDLCHRHSMATSCIQIHVIRSDAGGDAQPRGPESAGFR